MSPQDKQPTMASQPHRSSNSPTPRPRPPPHSPSSSPSSSSSSSSSVSSCTSPHWTNTLTLDLLLRVLHNTILHPFIAWLIPLCLRAQATPYSHPSFILTATYAALVTLVLLLAGLNRRIAYGPPREVDLGNEVVVVAGGASGLGLLVTEIYGMRGVSVAVLDIKEVHEGLGAGWEELPDVRYYKCDVGVREQVEDVVSRIENDLGTPTILINCVAAPINGLPLISLPPRDISTTIQANLLSYFHTVQVFLPRILSSPTGGTIVTISSVLSYLTAAGLSDYTATKAAISAVHKTLEAELRVSGDDSKVKLVLVETGQMATPLFEDIETPNNFFAPVLEPVQVAREIVSMVDSGKGGVIRLPAFASLVSWYSVLPASVQRLARFLSGIDGAVAKAAFAMTSEMAKVDEPSSSSEEEEGSGDDVELVKC